MGIVISALERGETLQHAVDHAKSKSWDLLSGVDKNQLARFSSTLRKAIENMEGQICASTQVVEIQNFLIAFPNTTPAQVRARR